MKAHKKQQDIKQQVVVENEENEYKEKYLRALADYQNLEKRMSAVQVDVQRKTRNDIIQKLLGVLDHLEKAESFMKDDGLSIIANDFRNIMDSFGLAKLDLVGKEYDPYSAEAIDVVEGEQDNIVTKILRDGYKIGDDIIRPAHVQVSKSYAQERKVKLK